MTHRGLIFVLCIGSLAMAAGCASGKSANQSASQSASATTAASASASATESASASGPATTVKIGPYTQVFVGSVPTNPAQASVINDFREAQILWEKSLQARHLVGTVTQFVLGGALSDLNNAIAASRQQGLAIKGTDQFFLTKVTNLSGTTATVTTCDNGSKLEFVQQSTGQTLPVSKDKAYALENWGMVQHSGHWAISSLSFISQPDPGALICQP